MSGRSSEKNTRGPKSKRESVQYSFVDYEATQLLLALAIGHAYKGGAMRIGLTRDGGALAIGVYAGDEYGVEYVKPTDDLLVELEAIAQAWGIPIARYDDVAGLWIAS